MSRALDKANAAVAAAEQGRDRWSLTLTEAEATLNGLVQTTPETPDELDGLGQQTVSARARVEGARRALEKAEARLLDARRNVLIAEADNEGDAAKAARKEAETLGRKCKALLDQLEALNGVRYVVPVPERPQPGEVVTFRNSRLQQLDTTAKRHEVHEAVLRYTAEHGRLPGRGYDFYRDGRRLPGGMHLSDVPHVPDTARAYAAMLAPAEPVTA